MHQLEPFGGGEALLGDRSMIDNAMIRMPSVACTPPQPQGIQQVAEPDGSNVVVSETHQTPWTFGGKPFAPAFVVEVVPLVDLLDHRDSRLEALERKMRREFFAHGVQLGWLVDPENKLTCEYKRGEKNNVYRVDTNEWRDLDAELCYQGSRCLP